ncbi:DUF202 domain-containing protein [Streptomyces sp. NPDC089919]|uniref:DUF202 domain-containing protein n=1 Tax=Streptomyces sp. NPDC089919 TaxID=3155188 RepID=UPI0034289363
MSPADPVPGAPGGRDPGLQPERTRLAWRRTTLTWTAVAVLAVKQALHGSGSPAELAGTAFIALLWAGFLYVSHRRIQALAAPRPALLGLPAALAAALCCVALTGFAVLLLVLSDRRP